VLFGGGFRKGLPFEPSASKNCGWVFGAGIIGGGTAGAVGGAFVLWAELFLLPGSIITGVFGFGNTGGKGKSDLASFVLVRFSGAS